MTFGRSADALFYQRYQLPFPNPEDHAGISDVAGTMRGAAGLFLDQQWGLFVAAPIFILTIVGVILMAQSKPERREVFWVGVVALPYTLVIANYAQWWGEWCPPARYLAPVLPLLALPFAFVLDNIHSILYKVIYGVLLLLSLLTTWGFLYQPQWVYNQPDGKSLLLLHGLPEIGSALGLPLGDINATRYLPSFVTPYFAYFKGHDLGDAAAQAAWRASIGPMIVIVGVVALCLILAYFGKRDKGASQAGGPSATGGHDARDIEMATAATPLEVAGPVSFRLARRYRAARSSIGAILRLAGERVAGAFGAYGAGPALAWAGGTSPGFRPTTGISAAHRPKQTVAKIAVRPPTALEGHRRQSPWLPYPRNDDDSDGTDNGSGVAREGGRTAVVTKTPVVTAPVVRERPAEPTAVAEPVPTPEPMREPVAASEKKVSFIGIIWRTRGLWLGLVAVGIAMYAQKLTTVDRNILQSIHWYILAIAVLLLGWLGTYKNRSFLVVPVPREKKSAEGSGVGDQVSGVRGQGLGEGEQKVEVTASQNGVEKPFEVGAGGAVLPKIPLSNGGSGVDEGMLIEWPVAPLPTRKRAAVEVAPPAPPTPPVMAEPVEEGLGMTSGCRYASAGRATGGMGFLTMPCL